MAFADGVEGSSEGNIHSEFILEAQLSTTGRKNSYRRDCSQTSTAQD
jgi:hypothetical protein